MRWTPRRTVRVAAVTAVATTGGLLAGVTAAFGMDAELSYACATQSGLHKVGVHVAGVTPASGVAGQPVQFGPVTVTVTLPPQTAGDLAASGAGEVGGTLRLAVTVTQNGQPADAGWPELPISPNASGTHSRDLAVDAHPPAGGADGDIRIVASGVVPPVTPTRPGEVTWSAGELSLTPAGGAAGSTGQDRSPDARGSTPAVAAVTCTPDREAKIAVISVPADTQKQGTPSSGAAAEPPKLRCQPPTGDINPDPQLALDPPRAGTTKRGPFPGIANCGLITSGRANVKKLNGAVPITGQVAIRRNVSSLLNRAENYTRLDGYALTTTQPATAMLLGFGFIPTTATTELTQEGMANLGVVAPQDRSKPSAYKPVVTVKAKMRFRVTSVLINGVPLNVGPRCSVSEPVLLKLTNDLGNRDVTDGGRYSGAVTVPPFSGCGVDENLDPLLTATISGPDNLIEINQSQLCLPNPADDNPNYPCKVVFPDPGR